MTDEHLSMIRGLTLFFLCIASAMLILTSTEILPAFIGVAGVILSFFWMLKDEERENGKQTIR